MGKLTVGVMDSPQGGSKKKRLIIAAAVTGLILIAAAVYYLMSGNDTKTDKDPTTLSPKTSKIAPVDVTYEQLSAEALTSKINYLMGTQQYSEAEKLITEQDDLNSNKSKLLLLAMVQETQKKTDEVLKTYEKILSLGNLSSGEYRSIAAGYEAAGNKAKAIEYYNKAIDVLNEKKQGAYQSDIRRLQDKIKELQ